MGGEEDIFIIKFMFLLFGHLCRHGAIFIHWIPFSALYFNLGKELGVWTYEKWSKDAINPLFAGEGRIYLPYF